MATTKPADEAAPAVESTKATYRVLMGAVPVFVDKEKKEVERHLKGAEVELDSEIVDVKRLLRMGAIAPVNGPAPQVIPPEDAIAEPSIRAGSAPVPDATPAEQH